MDLANQISESERVAQARQIELQLEWSGLAKQTDELDGRFEQFQRQEQKLAELELRFQILQSESSNAIEQLRAEHRQGIARLTCQLSEIERASQEQQAELKKVSSELAERTAELEKWQSEFDSQQKRWPQERQQQENKFPTADERPLQQPLQLAEKLDQQLPNPEEILAQTKLLADQKQELEAARQEFDRFVSINSNHPRGLAKIIVWSRIKRVPYRFILWLTGPFRGLKWAKRSAQQITDPQEILAQTKLLAAQRQKLEAARKKLEIERAEFDRFIVINSTQRQVLVNLNELRREKRFPYRFFKWLAGLFRKSD